MTNTTVQQGTLTSFFTKKPVSHTELVDNALATFARAETEMVDAIDQIQNQIDEEEREIAIRQGKILGANASKERLARVLDRVKAFTQ